MFFFLFFFLCQTTEHMKHILFTIIIRSNLAPIYLGLKVFIAKKNILRKGCIPFVEPIWGQYVLITLNFHSFI